MNRAFPIIICLVLLASARADDSRIARFDLKHVFEQYQHTKDLEAVINDKRFSRQPSDIDAIRERYDAARQRVNDALATNNLTQAGTSERERSELQLQLATLLTQYLELQMILERTKRAQTLKDESQRQRNELLSEIWSAATTLSNERGYKILFPDHLPSGGPFFPIIASGPADDLTEPLLARLNDQYNAKKSK